MLVSALCPERCNHFSKQMDSVRQNTKTKHLEKIRCLVLSVPMTEAITLSKIKSSFGTAQADAKL